MKKLTVRGSALWALLLFGVVPITLVAGAFMLQRLAEQRLQENRLDVRHSLDVVLAAQKLEIAVQDAERGQRGFLLTGQDNYLAPYRQGLNDEAEALGRLRSLIGQTPEEVRRLATIEAAISTKFGELEASLTSFRSGNRQQAEAIMNTEVGENSMRTIVSLLHDLVSAEQERLDARAVSSAATAQLHERETVLAGSTAVLALCVAAIVLYRAQLRLTVSEDVLQRTLDSVREGVGAFDHDRRLVAWNNLFVELLRLPPDFVKQGLSLNAIAAFEGNGKDSIAGDLVDLDLQSNHSGKPLLFERSREDGTIVELYHSPAGEGFVATCIDVTELRRSEAFLRHAHRIEALGQMTGGVAHDFNNLLTVIIGNLDRLETVVARDDGASRLVRQALHGAERGATLTRQLLAYARRQPLAPRSVNVAQLLPDLIEILRRSVGERIDIRSSGVHRLWSAMIDPAQFESALINLAVNARDAMSDGGRLTLELANVGLDAAYAARHSEVVPGQYVMVAVSDTGTGMPTEVVSRAFDPFFTTKEDGKGTGLGLSMVYGFAKQSGGHVTIDSELGRGTTVKLYLPRTFVSVEPEPRRGRPLAEQSGSESILVVEDDEDVRGAVIGQLTDLGYLVFEAAEGEEALIVLRSEQPIDLLFTDVVMPGPVTARALAAEAATLQPGIKIIYTSGYSQSAVIHHGRLDPGVNLLSKPYRRDELANRIRAVLDGHGDAMTRDTPLAS